MTARLHVMLGGGGVGKTTLAAGYALALTARGRRVGLLGIDPARRLEDALGVHLTDLDAGVPAAGALRAAIVEPHQAIGRWVAETTDADTAARLAANPFFRAFGDRLATAIDILAAARIAEWSEHDPALEDLVVDTAPGLAAIDFLRSPRELAAMIEGRLVGWLRAAARGEHAHLHAGARRVVGALAHLAGAAMIDDVAAFFAGVRDPLERMIDRVERARAWLGAADTELLLVTSPRDTGAAGARELAGALARERLHARAIVVNRVVPVELGALPAGRAPLVDYARALAAAQAGVIAAASALAPALVAVPAHAMIDAGHRGALAELGEMLMTGLCGA